MINRSHAFTPVLASGLSGGLIPWTTTFKRELNMQDDFNLEEARKLFEKNGGEIARQIIIGDIFREITRAFNSGYHAGQDAMKAEAKAIMSIRSKDK